MCVHIGKISPAKTHFYVCEREGMCIGGSHCCIVACTHLGNGIGCRTVTLVAPLLLTGGPVRYEAPLHNCGQAQWGGGVLVPTCDSVHLWQLYSAASLGHQTAGTMTCYPTQSHYPDTEPTSLCPILIMLSARLGIDNNQYLSLWLDWTRLEPTIFGFRAHYVTKLYI